MNCFSYACFYFLGGSSFSAQRITKLTWLHIVVGIVSERFYQQSAMSRNMSSVTKHCCGSVKFFTLLAYKITELGKHSARSEVFGSLNMEVAVKEKHIIR